MIERDESRRVRRRALKFLVRRGTLMGVGFSYVHEALALFSPENGLDEATAASLLRQQLEAPAWREGLAKELAAMLESDATDWLSVVDNDAFCLGEFEGPRDARACVERLLSPFVQS